MATTKKVKTVRERAKGMKTVDVKVLIDGFGTHKKGDVIPMHETTAAACAENGAVELVGKAKKK